MWRTNIVVAVAPNRFRQNKKLPSEGDSLQFLGENVILNVDSSYDSTGAGGGVPGGLLSGAG